jgi:D-lactate dehydrogenase
MNIALFSAQPYDHEYFDASNKQHSYQLTYFETALNASTTNLTVGFDAVCVFVNDKVDAATIEKLAKNGIKLIALRSAGFNNVDLKAAAANNIKVVRVPAYSPHAVAEHALALILTLNRKTHKAYNRVRESNFSLDRLVGFDLFHKTVGIVGTGQIGLVFCKIMQGLGCKVIAYDIRKSPQIEALGIPYVSFDDMLAQSDIISLHCPLTPDNYHLFDQKVFAKIKKGAMLINTSRGALINTVDAIEALKNEQLGYLGIDVYEQESELFFKDLSESIIQDDLIFRLMSFPNVLITAHQGFFTHEALVEIAATTLQNVQDFEEGIVLKNEVKLEK